MNAQFVDWGALAGLVGLAAFLWRMMANQTKEMNRRFDKQDKDLDRRFDKQDGDMAELRSDFGELRSDVGELRSDVGELQISMAVVKNDLGHVKNGLGHLRSRWDRMDDNILQIMRDLGKLEGEQRSSSPKEKIGAGGG